MWYYWLIFFFVAFFAKVGLAFVMIYLLLPQDGMCSHCDEEMLLMKPSRAVRFWIWIAAGRVERRWCPSCGWEGMSRRTRTRASWPVRQPGAAAPTRR